MIDLMKCVWDKETPYTDRLNIVQSKIDELWNYNLQEHNGTLLKGLRKLRLDIYYPFTTELEKIKNWSKKYKQLQLAKSIMKIVKDGDRKYNIDLNKKIDGMFFIHQFENDMNTTKFHLCSLGINFYSKPKYSFKTLVLGATKMKRLGFISKDRLNSFLYELERASNGK